MKRTLYITTLGKFSIQSVDGDDVRSASEEGGRSWRLWAFLQYLCVFHDRAVSQEEICGLLWSDLDSSSPMATIKTLLHRSRLLLEKLGFPDGKKALLYRRGVYEWSPELVIQTDTEAFDSLCASFENAPDSEEALDAARQAMRLYEGDFLPSAEGCPWALSPRTYYHAKYLRLCCDAADMLRQAGAMEEAIQICRAATEIDPYDEACHILMMQLLRDSGSKQAASQYYNDVSKLFMAQLGIVPSEEMSSLYHELSSSGGEKGLEMDLQTILTGLQGSDGEGGTFFCEYAVFQDIYQFMVRSALRTGQVVQLSLITLLGQDNKPLPQARRNAAMEELRKTIASCCRAGDVCAQFSASQYLLLLPSASHENGAMVIRRILNCYQKTMMGMTTCAHCSSSSALTSKQQEIPLAKAASTWRRQGGGE